MTQIPDPPATITSAANLPDGGGSRPAGLLRHLRWFGSLRTSGLVWVLLAMVIAATLVNQAFISPFNLVNVMRQMALFGIVSIGMTLVILTAGIDLSVGSVVAVAAVVCASLLDGGAPIPLVVLTGL